MIKEIVTTFLATTIIICLIFIVCQINRLSSVIGSFGLSIDTLLVPLFFMIIPYLSLLLPIALLFSLTLVFSRMSSENEIVILMTCGYNLVNIFRSILFFSIFCFVLSLCSSCYLESWGRKKIKRFIHNKAQFKFDNMIENKIKPGVFIDNFFGNTFYVESVLNNKEYKNVLLSFDQYDSGKTSPIIVADRSKLLGSVRNKNLEMIFYSGLSYRIDSTTGYKNTTHFSRLKLDLYALFEKKFIQKSKILFSPKYFNIDEIKDRLEKMGQNPAKNKKELFHLEYLYYSKISTPFIVFTFSIWGFLLGLYNPRKNKNFGFVWCSCIVLLTYVVLGIMRWLAEQGIVTPIISVWSAQLSLFFLSLAVFYLKIRRPLWETRLFF